ncbi:MAG: RNA polymerase sigma-70 factor [Chitinophagaceae bacterium]|nr:RNA polymerase sigma-70 factor [Chitinophagaceae bacterium]
MRNNEIIYSLFFDVCSNSNMKAYEQLYKILYARLAHFSASIVGSFQSAEEIVSDVFIMLWRKREQFVSVENPVVYLYVCVRNFSLNALPQNKARYIDFDALDKDALSVMPDIEERLVSREVACVIEKAIRDLPGRCQMIFRLIKIDGLSYKEAAELLGISPKTVDAQLAIAVKKLSLAIRLHTPAHLVNNYLKIS